MKLYSKSDVVGAFLFPSGHALTENRHVGREKIRQCFERAAADAAGDEIHACLDRARELLDATKDELRPLQARNG